MQVLGVEDFEPCFGGHAGCGWVPFWEDGWLRKSQFKTAVESLLRE